MKRFLSLGAALGIALSANVSMAASSVKGSVNFKGAKPQMKPISMAADPNCAKLHTKPLMTEYVLVNDAGKLQNVFVYIKTGLEGKKFPVPTTPVVFDQTGCRYEPHVFGVMTGQTIEILNSDSTLHNVHAMPTKNKEFNIGMPVKNMKMNRKFDTPEVGITIKCDVHPWMRAYISVLPHPFFAVSDASGAFEIKDLPAGKYTLAAWHEKMDEQTQEITVEEGKPLTVEFNFERAKN